MKIYALLIGIDEYPYAPLSQCVNDIKKVKAYLDSLDTNIEVHTLPLLNKDASKAAICEGITSFLGQARDEDTALIYYSGHGGQEETSGLFTEEYDGLMECLVCYHTEDDESGFLLADKEIRYLLSNLPHSPHLLTVFDCCHSGDMVRAFKKNTGSEQIRRIVDIFPSRQYIEFQFSDIIDENELLEKGFLHFAPYKNHIHLSACLSTESSWEDENGGVFTRYLLQLIKANKNQLRYIDIARWAKISLVDVTAKKQTPQIMVQGEGKQDAYSSWLNIKAIQSADALGSIIYNDKKKWIYNRGRLMGITNGMDIFIINGENEIKAKVDIAELEYASLVIDKSSELDTTKNYPAYTEQVFSNLKIYINDLDDDEEAVDIIRRTLSAIPEVELTGDGGADFYVNVFNKMVYFSLPESEFQPLAKQLDLINSADELEKFIQYQTPYFVKWNHYHSLENPAKDFDKAPLKIEIQLYGEDQWTDVSNRTFEMDPHNSRTQQSKVFFQRFQVRVTNLTRENLYVGVLTLNSDLSITSNPWQSTVAILEPGKPKLFYDHTEHQICGVSIDPYKEVYNWKAEWFYYKFIINNFDDFTNSLQSTAFKQPALEHPLIIEKFDAKRTERGEGLPDDIEENKPKWGTMMTRIELKNPEVNQITGQLEEYWEDYLESEELAPFIQMNYFDTLANGTEVELKARPNAHQDGEMASKATSNKIVIFANALFDRIRKRRFKRRRKKGGPIVVAEGDSWFLFPLPGVKDTLDYISKKYALRSLAAAGDEMEDYFKKGDLLQAVAELEPAYVLISGGGNDIVGQKIKDILISQVQNGTEPTDFINEEFLKKMTRLRELYEYFFEEIRKLSPGIEILVHGYDYIRHNPDKKTVKKGWANRYMIAAGIDDPDMRKRIIYYLVDTFNSILEDLDAKYDYVKYIDHRGTLSSLQWRDEIHPDNEGYGKVADNFLQVMTKST